MLRVHLLLGTLLVAALALGSTLLTLAFDAGLGPGAASTSWDFEDADDLAGWNTLGGGIALAPDAGAGGSDAMAISVESQLAWAVHDVAVPPGGDYRLGGVYVGGGVDWVQFSLIVRNAQGGQLEVGDSSQFFKPGTWLSSVFHLPCHAASGQVQIAVHGDPGSVAYVDDIRLKGAPPATPCATATATQTATVSATLSPTRTSTSAAAPSATRTPTPTRTATRTRTPTPTRTPAGSTTPSPTRTPPLTRTPTRTPASPPTPSHGLLVNGGFESADGDGLPIGWRVFGGALGQVGGPVQSGGHAGAFASQTSSTKWAYQTVGVEPGGWYEFAGYVYPRDAEVEGALLRVSWYESGDGSGSAVGQADSTEELVGTQAGYRWLTTGAVQAPAVVHSANARVLLRPRSAAEAVVYLDDLSFSPSGAPAATPTLGAPPALSPTPTPSPRPSTTPTARASATPTLTPATVGPQPTATATRAAAVAATATPGARQTATPTPITQATPSPAPDAGAPPTPSHGLLVNGGFESADEAGQPLGWQTFGGTLRQVGEPVQTGGHAGAFTSSTGSTKWTYQAVGVEPGGWYEFGGYVYQDDAEVEGALLRVSWYESGDGSGSAVGQVDSTEELVGTQAGYRWLTTGAVQAPAGAHAANARVLLRPRSAAEAVIYLDELSFSPAAAQEAPPAPAASDDGVAAAVQGSGGTRGPSGARASSDVLGLARPQARLVLTPQPTPVIVRGARGIAEEPTDDRGIDLPASAWVLIAGVAVAGAGGWAAWWLERRRGAPSFAVPQRE